MGRRYPSKKGPNTRRTPVIKKVRNKKVRGAQAVTVDNISFKSKLEVFCYRKLKESGIPFEYEVHKFVLFEGFRPNFHSYFPDKLGDMQLDLGKIRDMTYTPDFVGSNWIIETKGKANDVYPVKLKFFRRWLEGNSKYKMFLEPHNQKQILQCIEIIKQISNK